MELYQGLQQSLLNDFDVLLSGYIPSAEGVRTVGKIGRLLKFNASMKPGSFFWVLDPVMGDEGHLYVPEDEVPAYKSILRSADLILPNQFEAELLSDVKITSFSTLATAMLTLHRSYQVPHIVITSLQLRMPGEETGEKNIMSVIGSSATSDWNPRLWRIDVPAYPVFFSGTGDMFAALMVARLREAVLEAGLQDSASWRSPNEVSATELPLAKAAEKVIASMQSVLVETYGAYKAAVPGIEAAEERAGRGTGEDAAHNHTMKLHLMKTKAAEVRVVRNVRDLIDPLNVELYKARNVEVDIEGGETERKADELGVVNLGGAPGQGAVNIAHDEQ